ncbi:hypothetical protein BAZMOX_00432_1 [methanotrophic endosymbiont of Bathymodiolus azoricus (Menez Gwen)]|nr:hypothetical protein BAZMOX_00432_1 [methanotrophic endosymbiont of Bathymodiolus azoricus (Menez Gwen)]
MRFRVAPVTTVEVKQNLFAPVDKIGNPENYQIETTVYSDNKNDVVISGTRLTQLHRDILDIALYHGSYKLEDEVDENMPIRTFSLHQIQKHLNHKQKNNQAWLKKKFQELKRATILIYDKDRDEDIEFNIIRVAKRSHKLGEFVLVMEELYMAFFENEISVNYKELLPSILGLKHPQTKAIVRYLLSHQSGHQINIDKLLRKIGLQGEEGNLKYYRRVVLEELEEIGDKFNIELIKTSSDGRRKNDITVKYTKHKEVQIYHPQATLF